MRCKGTQGDCLCREHAPYLPNETQTLIIVPIGRVAPRKNRIPVPGKFAKR